MSPRRLCPAGLGSVCLGWRGGGTAGLAVVLGRTGGQGSAGGLSGLFVRAGTCRFRRISGRRRLSFRAARCAAGLFFRIGTQPTSGLRRRKVDGERADPAGPVARRFRLGGRGRGRRLDWRGVRGQENARRWGGGLARRLRGRGGGRFGGRALAGKLFVDRLAGDDRSVGVFESGHQGEAPGRTAHGIPGNPEAVGVPDLRLAVMPVELFGKEDEDFFGLRAFLVVIEGQHRELAGNDARFLFVFAVEHDPSAEAADARFARLMQDGVGPQIDDLGGTLRIGFPFLPQLGSRPVQIGAAGQGGKQARRADCQHQEEPAVSIQNMRHVCRPVCAGRFGGSQSTRAIPERPASARPFLKASR